LKANRPVSEPNRSISRRKVLAGAALPALSFAQPTARRQPNILLIMADDLAAWMLGCYGNREIHTPHIDALARGGIRFLNSFVCTPAGSPSRATLFTGRTPMQHGIQDFLTDRPIDDPPQGQFAPPPSFANETMLSDILAGRRYRCGFVGRWHMGSDQNPQHEFEFWYTLVGRNVYQNPRMSQNGQLRDEKGYLPDLITQGALRFLDNQQPDQPFFLVVSHLNPHAPYQGHPQKYYDQYANSSFEGLGWEPAAPNALREKNFLQDMVASIRQCAAATTALDDQLPPLLTKLQERGLRQDTLILLVGDNGFLLGRHGLWSAGHASYPINMYEEVVRVPVICNWPGKTPVQAARPELVSFYDVVPTLCEACGAPVPDRNLCGRSFLPLLMGRSMPRKEPWRNLVFGLLRNTAMARDNRYKLVRRNEGKGPNEFYDLRGDPRENQNQYDNPQFLTVRDRLARDLASWTERFSS
jgi:arylsulfatase A-like enzyme